MVATPPANPFPRKEAAGSEPVIGALRGRLWELLRGRLMRLLRLWHLTSLDAPTVAMVWGWAFAWTARIRLAAWPLALLGLVVWAVYIGDRLLDARTGRELRERHHFHWQHRRVLAPLAAAAALAATWIVRRRVPEIAMPQDSAVALATLAYFSGVHGRLRLPGAVGRVMAALGSRECLVGTLFATGCVLPAWSVNPVAAALRVLVIPVAYFSAVAWLNVRAITCWESGKRLGRMAWLLAGSGMLLAAGMAVLHPRAAALVSAGAVSTALIGWLDRVGESAVDPVLLRAAVDLVLLTPVLLVVVR